MSNYTIQILEKHRRDLIATANELEVKMADMLDPNTEASIDRIRGLRLKAEELQRSIAILTKHASSVVNLEDVG